MKKSTIPQGLKGLKKWYDAGTLNLDHPIQRASAQWNLLQQSLLIHSILSDYIIPPIYFIKEKVGKNNVFHLIEGKQRLTSLFDFISDEYSLHAKTPAVVIEGKEYSLALKKFSELDDELREEILGFFFTIYQIEDATEEEIEESFARLNSGTPLSKIQLARPKMGTELADWCNKLVQKDFFQRSLNMTVAQLRREDDFLMLVTTMMLLDERSYNGFKIKTSASASECVRFAEHIKNKYSEEKRKKIETLVEYLDEVFGGAEYKFLRKNNIPIVMFIANVAVNNKIPAKDFLNVIVEFFESDCTEAYNNASGSGNVKMININTRINELLDYLMSTLPAYFRDDDEIPSEFISEVEGDENETSGEDEPVDESTCDETENSNTSDDENFEDNNQESSLDDEEENDAENNGSSYDASELEAEYLEDGTKEDIEAPSNGVSEAKEPKYVLFHLSTNNVGQEKDEVYEVDDTDEKYLNEIGHDMAYDNAESYGIEVDGNVEDEAFSYSWEIVEDLTREEIIELYGSITRL